MHVTWLEEGRSPRGRRSRTPRTARKCCTRVDLRAGGGARPPPRTMQCPPGRSPRGRRSQQPAGVPGPGAGSISARAEEPAARCLTIHAQLGSISARAEEPPQRGLHPKGPGSISARAEEPRSPSPGTMHCQGRSPRGRRSPASGSRSLGRSGSISARAEEPLCFWLRPVPMRVDLRAGGGAKETDGVRSIIEGRSPRGRRSPYPVRFAYNAARVDLRAGGGAPAELRRRCQVRGRSPRGRRSRGVPHGRRHWPGSISARAEEPPRCIRQCMGRRVDLRAGGGAIARALEWAASEGRSPRGRRSRKFRPWECLPVGSISARAEEPPARYRAAASPRVDLRAGGGAPASQVAEFASLVKEHESARKMGLRTRREPSCSTSSFGDSPRVSTLSPPGAPASRHAMTMLPACN